MNDVLNGVNNWAKGAVAARPLVVPIVKRGYYIKILVFCQSIGPCRTPVTDQNTCAY
jgi:hypothetical protein